MNGGHLAPSLGVVELTLALLSAFDPGRDKLVWDVGHQAYAYKILTGRLEQFHTLRTMARSPWPGSPVTACCWLVIASYCLVRNLATNCCASAKPGRKATACSRYVIALV